MSDYFYEKSKMYYEKFLAKKLTKKVGSIIKSGDKYLTIIREGKSFVLLVGVLMRAKPRGKQLFEKF